MSSPTGTTSPSNRISRRPYFSGRSKSASTDRGSNRGDRAQRDRTGTRRDHPHETENDDILTATVTYEEDTERARLALSRSAAVGDWTLDDLVHGHPQRQTARFLPQHVHGPPGCQAAHHCHDPVRGHRRPPGLPLLGRAGVQGGLRCHAGSRFRSPGGLQCR